MSKELKLDDDEVVFIEQKKPPPPQKKLPPPQRQQQQQQQLQQLQQLQQQQQQQQHQRQDGPKEQTTKTLSILNNQHLIQTKKPHKILKRASDSSPIAIISKDVNEPNIKNDTSTIFDRNPLQRLCEVLTQWNILNDVISGNNYNNQEDHVPPPPSSRIETIPTIFESCAEYYNTWEPLLIDEIKANICTNLVHNTRSPSKTGKLIIGIPLI